MIYGACVKTGWRGQGFSVGGYGSSVGGGNASMTDGTHFDYYY